MRPLEEYRIEILDLLAENESMTTESIREELVKKGFRKSLNRRVLVSALKELLKEQVVLNHRDSAEHGEFTLKPGWSNVWSIH